MGWNPVLSDFAGAVNGGVLVLGEVYRYGAMGTPPSPRRDDGAFLVVKVWDGGGCFGVGVPGRLILLNLRHEEIYLYCCCGFGFFVYGLGCAG